MKKSILILLCAAGAFCAQSCNPNNRSADDSVEQAMDQNEEVIDNEGEVIGLQDDPSDFAVQAADAGMAEVSAGEIAQEKAQNQAVKDFAAMMVQDHTKANEELKTIADNNNITLPTAAGEEHQEKIADLNEYTGAEFDKEYIDMMVKDHEKTINLFEDAAENSENEAIQAFASKTLPTLRKHLEEAETLQETLE